MVTRGIQKARRTLNYLRWRGSFWWHKNRRRYGIRWHIGNGLAAVLLLASIILPIVQNIQQDKAYALSLDTKKLVGNVDDTLKKQLTYDAKNAQYQFNKDGIASDKSLPPEMLKATTGTPKNKDSATYSLDVPVDMKKGVTYHDTNSQLSFSLVPNFKSMAGRQVDGHLVYPLPDDVQAVYTLKNNGLKEDIVVPQVTSDTMTFSYTLNVPKTLEAKVIPGGGGAIGLYSADPALFGDISFGSDSDRQAVQKARENAEKTTLVFGLPAPVLRTADGSPLGKATARFELDGNKLSVIASGLQGLHVPITIDPSVVVTSTSDFQTNGNNEGMISFGNGIVGAPTGSVGTWATTSSFTTPRDMDTSTVVSNGYMYVLGGYDYANTSASLGDAQYALINANGTLGAWASTTALPALSDGHGTAAYNGVIYICGGYTGSTRVANCYYSTINGTNGTLGAWTSTTALPTARDYLSMVAYNGYVYAMGGYDGTNYLQDVQYAKINTGGSLGAWAATSTSISTLMGEDMAATVYNGYIYLFGSYLGSTNGTSNLSTYVKINADGTLGAWVSTANFPTYLSSAEAAAYNGYVYVTGGDDSSWYRNNVWYAPLNADGSVGAWNMTTSFDRAREYLSTAINNGYLYVLGGRDDSGNNYSDVQFAPIATTQSLGAGNQVQRGSVSGGTVGPWGDANMIANSRYYNAAVAYNGYIYTLGGYDGTTYYNDVQYAQINPNGSLGAWGTTASFATARRNPGAVAYNGYMYIFGGKDGTGNYLNDVQYAPIGSGGTLGTWQTTTSFTTGRMESAYAAYNNYLYVIAGVGAAEQSDAQYAPINANGTIGTWQTTTGLSAGRDSVSMAVYNGYFYILGGWSGSAALGDVQYAPINANGTLGAWTSTTSFTTARYLGQGFAYNGYLYIMGGCNTTTSFTDVQYAPINANGSIGAWNTTTSLLGAVNSMAGTQYNGYFYVIGGNGAANRVRYAKTDPIGMPVAFATTTALPNARAMPCSVAYNGYIYEIGGNTSDSTGGNVSTVYKATLSTSGTVGAWTTSGGAGLPNLPESRGYAGCTVANGYIYLAGGYTGTGTADGAVRYIKINSDGTLAASWSNGTTLPHTTIGRTLVSATAGNGTTYLYSVGGLNSVSSTDATGVYYAPLTASTGAVGTWTTASSLLNNFRGSSVAVLGSHIYAIGGADLGSGTVTHMQVEYTTISSSGSLAAWQATTSLPQAISYGDATTVGGCIYEIGGQSTINGTPIVPNSYACPNADGTISQWYFTQKLSSDETDISVTSYNGYLYGLGGNNGSSNVALVQYALANSGGGGTMASWSNSANTFTQTRYSNTSVAYNGYLYITGGYTGGGGTAVADVQYAAINANGTLGTWQSTTSLPTAHYGHTTIAYNGYMYDIGGTNGTTWSNTVNYAPINSSTGAIGTWNSTTSFATARDSHSSFIYNGYLYVAGGYHPTSDTACNPTANNGCSDVQYAAIQSNGQLSSWTATSSFTTPRAESVTVAYNGYAYLVGGSGSSAFSDTQYAQINSNGTLGSWQGTNGIGVSRYGHVAAVYNGYLYILGGYTQGGTMTGLPDIQYAPLNNDGTVGTWSVTNSYSTSRYGLAGAIYNGYVYVTGGISGSGVVLGDTQYTTLNMTDLTGHYSKLIDLGSVTNVSSITYNGVLPGGNTAISYKGAGVNGVFTASGTANKITATSPCGGSLANTRYLWVSIALDDSGAIAGGATGGTTTPAYMTDFTVNYSRAHPAPNVRLHLGKTLQQGQGQSPLDTCYP